MIFTTQSEIETYQQNHPDSILFQTVVHPDYKVAPEIKKVSLLSGGCIPQSLQYSPLTAEDKVVKSPTEHKLLVSLTPLSKEELADFLQFASALSVEYKNEVQFDFDSAANVNSEPMRGHIRTTRCDKIVEIANRFAQRREVYWLERSHNIVKHNYWARGVCDTNNYASAPLDQTALNGTGEIVGVADSGIDMLNCYFHQDIAFNYQLDSGPMVLNPDHRKVIQYVYQITTDTNDNDADGGHGTGVAASVLGESLMGTTDTPYEEFNGMAQGAKVAFFDIGESGNPNLELPVTLDSGLFQK